MLWQQQWHCLYERLDEWCVEISVTSVWRRESIRHRDSRVPTSVKRALLPYGYRMVGAPSRGASYGRCAEPWCFVEPSCDPMVGAPNRTSLDMTTYFAHLPRPLFYSYEVRANARIQ